MVAGYHLIWTIYGWWLPNDPRGSTSREIRSAAIAGLGELHYGRKRIQPAAGVIRDFHTAARAALQHALRELSAAEIAAVGDAFAAVIRTRNYTCYGCAILPDHVHLLIRKTPRSGGDHDRSTAGREPGGGATTPSGRA